MNEQQQIRALAAALEASRAREAELREALEEIAEGKADTDHQEHCYQWRKRARAALAAQPAEGQP